MAFPKKVLITGATGLVGSTVYIALAKHPEKYELYALDRNREYNNRVPEKNKSLVFPTGKFHICDITDAQAVLEIVSGMDVVVHFAANPGSNEWESLLNSNVIGTYNVFEACRQTGVNRIIAASSMVVAQGYREKEPYKAIAEKRFSDVPERFPYITHENPVEPRNIYGATKVWTESLARIYAHKHGISCICLRLGQVERDSPRTPDSHAVFVTQRDLIQLVECCIDADEAIRFEIFFGISANKWRWVDLEYARERIGYEPKDGVEE